MSELKAVIAVEVDSNIKKEAELILANINLDLSEAINLFLNYLAIEKTFPVCLLEPNSETIAALNDVAEQKVYQSVDELWEDSKKE